MGIILRNLSSNGLSNIRMTNKRYISNMNFNSYTLNDNAVFDSNTMEGYVSDNVGSGILFDIPVSDVYIEIEHYTRGSMVYGFSTEASFLIDTNTGNITLDDRIFFEHKSSVNVNGSQIRSGDISSYILRDNYLYFFKNSVLLHSTDLPVSESYYLKFISRTNTYGNSSFKILEDNNLYYDCEEQI